MSGHSKWSTIKRKKGALDAKRSKMFTKIVKEIQVAVKEGGSDPEGNARLRIAIQNAKGVNMPKDNVTKAIAKGTTDTSSYSEMTFEGYGPSAVALFVECLTDNNLRTLSNVKSIFNKRNATLGTNGSLAFIFDRKGIFTINKEGIDIDEFEMEVIDGGAEEIEVTDEHVIVTTALEDFGNMQKKLDEMKIEPENSELQRIPSTTKEVDLQLAQQILRMIEALEEDDDVQQVYHNMQITDEIAEQL